MLSPMGNFYVLTENITIADLIIPKGFQTNGASIPSALWGILESPFSPRIIIPAIYHDYAYRRGHNRKHADQVFYGLLLEAGISRVKAILIYNGVRMFGGRYFKKCTRC